MSLFSHVQHFLAAPSAPIFFAKNPASVEFWAPRAPGGTPVPPPPHTHTPEQQHKECALLVNLRQLHAFGAAACAKHFNQNTFLPWLGKQGYDSFSFFPCKPYCQLQRTWQTSQHAAAYHANTSMQLIGASFGSASLLLLLPLAIKRERIQDEVPPSIQDLRMQDSS